MKATKIAATTENMRLTLHYENASGLPAPKNNQIRQWVEAAIEHKSIGEITGQVELAIRIVNRAESTRLNDQYRGKNTPTNVLSFPADIPATVDSLLLGDLAICAEVVIDEAAEQQKPLNAHWAHMVIHGCLHLQGFDHETEAQALQMEQLETQLLAGFGFADPYLEIVES